MDLRWLDRDFSWVLLSTIASLPASELLFTFLSPPRRAATGDVATLWRRPDRNMHVPEPHAAVSVCLPPANVFLTANRLLIVGTVTPLD